MAVHVSICDQCKYQCRKKLFIKAAASGGGFITMIVDCFLTLSPPLLYCTLQNHPVSDDMFINPFTSLILSPSPIQGPFLFWSPFTELENVSMCLKRILTPVLLTETRIISGHRAASWDCRATFQRQRFTQGPQNLPRHRHGSALPNVWEMAAICSLSAVSCAQMLGVPARSRIPEPNSICTCVGFPRVCADMTQVFARS